MKSQKVKLVNNKFWLGLAISKYKIALSDNAESYKHTIVCVNLKHTTLFCFSVDLLYGFQYSLMMLFWTFKSLSPIKNYYENVFCGLMLSL